MIQESAVDSELVPSMKPSTSVALPEEVRGFLLRVAVAVTCGALGGFCIGVGVPVTNALGLTNLLGVAIHPQLTTAFLYSKVVWGGIWGPIMMWKLNLNPFAKGCVLGALGPGLVQLFIVFPLKDTPGSIAGLTLGVLTPLLVLFYNAILWGIPSSVAFAALTSHSRQSSSLSSSRSLSDTHDLEGADSKFF